MTRLVLGLLVLGLTACDLFDSNAACALSDDMGCDECADGDVTCSFDGVSETRLSCGDCQAREALYLTLCEVGTTATADEIEMGTVCEPAASEVCALAQESQTCPECADGTVTCSFDTFEATELSCGGCQARAALYTALCEANVIASRQDIEDGTMCVDAVR